jgi:Protein of unknown function (DUF2934)
MSIWRFALTFLVPIQLVNTFKGGTPSGKEFAVKITEQQPSNLPKSPTHLQEAAPPDIALQEQVRQRAYQIYEERGRLDGFEVEDWLRAELEVLGHSRLPKAA